jgi:hypothetical protein
MTLQERNTMFKAGIILCFLSAAFICAASIIIIKIYSSLDTEIFRRPAGLFQNLAVSFLKPNLYAVHTSIAVLALYSLITLIFILYYFEKTQTPEIPFFAFFVLSLAFESVRLMMPLQYVFNIPSFYLLLASRILLFSRNFGLFSLFAASIYAAGMESQRQRNVIFIITISSLIIALGTPVDTFTWSSNFESVSGYDSIFRILNAGVFLLTIAGFLIAAHAQRSRDYLFISLGVFLVLAGRNILLSADTWLSLPGIALLGAGTWFICIYLHKVYLWL